MTEEQRRREVERVQRHRRRKREERLAQSEGTCHDCLAVLDLRFVEIRGLLYCPSCGGRHKGLASARSRKVVQLALPVNIGPSGRNIGWDQTPVTSAVTSVPLPTKEKPFEVVGKNLDSSVASERGSGGEVHRLTVVNATWEPEELESRTREVIRWWLRRVGSSIAARDARAAANFDMPLPVLKTALERALRQLKSKGIEPRTPRIFRLDLQEAQSEHHKGRRPVKGSGPRSMADLVARRG